MKDLLGNALYMLTWSLNLCFVIMILFPFVSTFLKEKFFVKKWKELAEQGDSQAQIKMIRFAEGRLFGLTFFFPQSAQKRNQKNRFFAYIYDLVKRYEDIMLHSVSLAANQAHNDKAQHHMGYFYHHGIYVKKNMDQALHYYNLSASQGYLPAQHVLACCLLDGVGMLQDTNKAIRSLETLALSKFFPSVTVLGYCYMLGQGVNKDLERAFQYFSEAAKNGEREAQYELAKFYWRGDIVPKNKRKAKKLFTKSGGSGFYPAKRILRARCWLDCLYAFLRHKFCWLSLKK